MIYKLKLAVVNSIVLGLNLFHLLIDRTVAEVSIVLSLNYFTFARLYTVLFLLST